MKLRDDVKEEIVARALLLLGGALVLLVLSLTGCSERPVPVNVAGSWSYTWQAQMGAAPLHGTMVLAQAAESVTGNVGFPVDYPANAVDLPSVEAVWDWSVAAQVNGDFVPMAVTTDHSAFDDDWLFNVTVDGDAMGGPAFGGLELKPGYTFAAVRQ